MCVRFVADPNKNPDFVNLNMDGTSSTEGHSHFKSDLQPLILYLALNPMFTMYP